MHAKYFIFIFFFFLQKNIPDCHQGGLLTLSQTRTKTALRYKQASNEVANALPGCYEVFPLVLMTVAAACQLPAKPGLFDLVILDEGSQSEPNVEIMQKGG